MFTLSSLFSNICIVLKNQNKDYDWVKIVDSMLLRSHVKLSMNYILNNNWSGNEII